VGAHVRGADERVLKPRQALFATGVSAIPIMPVEPRQLAGMPMHLAQVQNGGAWKGKNAIVIGTGNSGQPSLMISQQRRCDLHGSARSDNALPTPPG